MAHRSVALAALSRQHHDALVLAMVLTRRCAPGVTPAPTPALLGELAQAVLRFWDADLLGHFHAEEDVLFPAFTAASGGVPDALVLGLLEEHLRLRTMVFQLRDAEREHAARRALLADFGGLLERHVRREERGLFDAIQTAIGSRRLEGIVGFFMQRYLPPQEHDGTQPFARFVADLPARTTPANTATPED